MWAVPLIESRKEKAKAQSVLNCLILEIEDELNELPRRLAKMAETLTSLKSLQAGFPEVGRPCKYVPRSTNLYFLKSTTEFSFGLLNMDQRYAIKSLFFQIIAIDEYLQAIKSTKINDKTLDEAINNCKRYLFTGSSMLNTMRLIAKYSQGNLSNDDKIIIEEIFVELDIKLNSDDLKIKSTTNFENVG